MILRILTFTERNIKCHQYITTSSGSITQICKFSSDYDPATDMRISLRKKNRREERRLMPPTDDPEGKGYLIKLLCPSLVTEQMPEYGASWITGIRNYSGANIVISKDGELFPRTDERVIAISGSYESIVKAINVLVPDLLSPPNKPKTRGRYPQLIQTPQHVRILIPSSCLDSIIRGQEGMNIIFITEESRCDIHVEDDRSLETFETILTVSTLRHTEDLLYGTQLTIWQVIECAESYPYLIKGVTYGHGRFERTKYVRPNVGNLRPCDADKYIPLFQDLIAAHRQKKKMVRKRDKKIPEVVGGRRVIEVKSEEKVP